MEKKQIDVLFKTKEVRTHNMVCASVADGSTISY